MTRLSLLLLAAIPSSVAQLVATKWEMDNPTFTLGEGSEDDNNEKAFTFQYGGISHLITIADASYAFFDYDCATEVDTAGAFTVPDDGFSLDPATAGSNDGVLKLIFEAEPQVITPTSLYTGGENGGQIKFCVRTSLNLISTDPVTEINFLETNVIIDITLDGTFTTETVSVAPKDKTTTTSDQKYEVEAKMCNEDDEEKTFNQGSVISVCVRPKGEAVADGIIMASVDSFVWTRGDDGTTQPAVKMVDDEMVAHDALSSYDLEDDGSVITISSVLFASFYKTTGTVTATGSATMQFPGVDRRRLGDGNNSLRRLQEEGAEAGIPPSPFDVQANVVAATDGPVLLQTAGGQSTTTSMIGAIVVGIVSAVLLA